MLRASLAAGRTRPLGGSVEMKRLMTLFSVGVLAFGSGCASLYDTFGNATPVVCAIVGGGLGAGAAAIASNWHHGTDNRDDLKQAAAIGGGVGPLGGALLCALNAPEENAPPTLRPT